MYWASIYEGLSRADHRRFTITLTLPIWGGSRIKYPINIVGIVDDTSRNRGLSHTIHSMTSRGRAWFAGRWCRDLVPWRFLGSQTSKRKISFLCYHQRRRFHGWRGQNRGTLEKTQKKKVSRVFTVVSELYLLYH